MKNETLSRRSFLALLGTTPLAVRALAQEQARKPVPIGIQIYSVREEEKQDRMGTLKALREMGYEAIEFYAPYYEWTDDYAREVRRRMDDLGLRCYSNHTSAGHFTQERLPRAIELNKILGSNQVIMAHAGRQPDLDGWKRTAETLSKASETLRQAGMHAGYHNWDVDFRPIEGTRPIDVLTSNTPKEVGFQLDVATCMAAGSDPIAFIKANAGRIKNYHLKDWSPEPDKRGRVLLGEGIGPWKELLEVAETVGGVEVYQIEQEGSRFTPMDTAKRCLDYFMSIRRA